jgi:hypothetical protein
MMQCNCSFEQSYLAGFSIAWDLNGTFFQRFRLYLQHNHSYGYTSRMMSRFSIHAGYASNGDSTFMEVIEKTHTSIGKKDVANMYAEFEVSNRSLGLISRLGYHQYLADYLVQEIVVALKDLYAG